ncbi:MAG: glucose-6-phosphate dehydrogenase [Kiritimatiellae bacterium]|nr:glucose-6-phosphate dehydrogenase [Kiritimatiellia bacterium]
MRVSGSDSPARPLPRIAVDEPFTLVIFGASGDLTLRKLLPALFALFVDGLLPERFAIIGFARREWTDESFREKVREGLHQHGRVPGGESRCDDFCRHVFYHRGDLTDGFFYGKLRERWESGEQFPANRLFYLATRPELFVDVALHLDESGLITAPQSSPWTRVVVEKPFGHDLASAHALSAGLLKHLDESQIYRIDHYLGKETVQNILSFRFGNAIFDPLFNNRYVDHVQITAAESIGIEAERGAYYDATGALRDMVQNHLLQLLCLVALEPPDNLTAAAIHNEKAKVLQALQPIGPVAGNVVRGQYMAGENGGEKVPAYVEEQRIEPGSTTETYVAMRVFLQNWRWGGVPFFLRTGKRLAKKATEIAVQFRMPPLQLFQTVECEGDACDLVGAKPNVLVFRIQPDEGISLQFSAKRPVMQMVVENVNLDFSYAEAWKRALPEAYERLLLDVMRGDATLFTRSDEVEAAWAFIDPILRAWGGEDAPPLFKYKPGTWGPREADALLEPHGAVWRER